MRITKYSIGIAASNARILGPGFTPWVVLNHLQNYYGVMLVAVPSSDAAGPVAMTGQYTFDPQDQDVGAGTKDDNAHFVTITRAATTATVVDPLGHGLSTGDGVTIYGAGAPFDGQQPTVTVTNATTYTYPVPNSGATASIQARQIIARVLPITALTGAARVAAPLNLVATQGVIATAVRLNVTAITAGYVDFVVIQGSGSMS